MQIIEQNFIDFHQIGCFPSDGKFIIVQEKKSVYFFDMTCNARVSVSSFRNTSLVMRTTDTAVINNNTDIYDSFTFICIELKE